jgi:aminoglycoside 3-N-acetyltransferase
LSQQKGTHSATGLSQRQIEESLRQLGLKRGAQVEVHSSLSSLGWVEGGAAAVVDALMDVVGPQGTLVMSAYRVSPPLPLDDEDRALGITWKVRLLGPYDPLADERSGMGAIADEFRRRPDAVCGEGDYPICAWGRDAAAHAQGYHVLLERDGWVLLIGVDVHRCSSMHQAEDQVGLPPEVEAIFAIPDAVLRRYPEDQWGVGCGEPPEDAWAKVWQEADAHGDIRHGRIGRADCALFRARALVERYADHLRRDPLALCGLARAGAGPEPSAQ